MELKNDGILFINLVFRIVSLLVFVNDYESPNLPINGAVLSWNSAVSDRVILILANGLRDDFLQLGVTPFLQGIADENGTFAKIRIDEIVSVEAGLKTVLTGVPWHASLLPWNRPVRYKTILDYISCKCVIGDLPASALLECRQSGRNQSEIFGFFRKMKPMDEAECIYVLAFDFGGVSGRDYVEMLRRLDEEVREASAVWDKSTWLLTSSRGWSVWNRSDARVDVPLLTWGKGIRPVRKIETLRLPDVPALASTLLGRTFPAGCLGQIPTYLIATDYAYKLDMVLYNYEHLVKTIGYPRENDEEDEFEFRNLKSIVDRENLMSLKMSVDTFLELVEGLRVSRLKMFTVAMLSCFALWSAVFAVVVVRGFLTIDFDSSVVTLNVTAAIAIIVYLYPGSARIALMLLLTPATILSFSEFFRCFHAEGYRMFFLSIVTSALCTTFSLFGHRVIIPVLAIPVVFWPFFSGASKRMNRKILMAWFVSSAILLTLPFLDVIGCDPTPGLTIFSGVLHVGFFHTAYRCFKRRTDRQSWLITAAVITSIYHVYFFQVFGLTTLSCVISWCLMLGSLSLTFPIRGTLLERHLKIHLLLLVPMQLLSVRHEPVFHVALSIHSFSWLFIENLPFEKSVLSYSPSVFAMEYPTELSPGSLQLSHYRQVFFFLILSYLTFFAVGNRSTVYTYDYAIVRPFCGILPLLLIFIKLVIPFSCLVHTFLTLHYTKQKDPATFLIVSIHFSDAIASSILINALILTDFFVARAFDYIILQIATATVTALYFLHKYSFFRLKT